MMLSTIKSIITEAPTFWRHLDGIINIYKPAGVSMKQVQTAIITNLCRDLNGMEVRPPKQIVKIEEIRDDQAYNSAEQSRYVVKQEQSLADHVLVVGKRYQPADFKSNYSCHLGKFSSGVLVLGINKGVKTAFKLRENRPIRVYHVTGKFGSCTESHFNDSAVTLRATFEHIHLVRMNSFLSSLQASHQKKMFELSGVDIQSQTAFDLAAQGVLRPTVSNIPLVYSLRCIDFRKPYFTIEIHSVNESEAYLGILIHEIGLGLKSVAHCTQIRCIRQSHFTLEDTLVRRHWNVENILNNMTRCQKLINKYPEMLEQLEANLQEK